MPDEPVENFDDEPQHPATEHVRGPATQHETARQGIARARQVLAEHTPTKPEGVR